MSFTTPLEDDSSSVLRGCRARRSKAGQSWFFSDRLLQMDSWQRTTDALAREIADHEFMSRLNYGLAGMPVFPIEIHAVHDPGWEDGNYRLIVKADGLCPANVPILVRHRRKEKTRLMMHMKPAGIDSCSYGDLE